jgi:3',5'-cyclic AMP phosphodiesterase CpdA
MRTVVHLSDLHFGAVNPTLVDAVQTAVINLQPDVVAVSGDLTQRARRRQFLHARAFLDSLPFPQVVVPGNHDVPLYNAFARFLGPRRAFRRYVTDERYPTYADDEIFVVGADTTRSLTVQDGGLRRTDVQALAAKLQAPLPNTVRIVVCHHPFDPPSGRAARWTRPVADRTAAPTLIAAGADVFLTGHLHLTYVGHTAVRYRIEGRAAIVVEAGTATSVRGRGETNAFNLLRIDNGTITIERMEWTGTAAGFVPVQRDLFVRGDDGWRVRQ